MSDTHDHDKTTFVRAPGAAPAVPEEPVDAHDQTFMMKPSARAREAAAALSAERESKRAQTLPPQAGGGTPALESVDFDVTAGFGDAAPTEAEDFFDITQGADADAAPATAAAAPTPPPAVTPAPTPAPTPTPTEMPAPATGGSGKLALVAVIVAAIIAAGLWFALR